MKIMTRYLPVAAALACCLSLAACGTEHAGARAAAAPASVSSATDGTTDGTTDETGDETGDQTTDEGAEALPDTTTDDGQETLPDTTTDDGGQELPDTTTDDPGPPMGDTTDDGGGVPTAGPHRWFPMLREFRGYLTTNAPKADAALASHVKSVYTRVPAGSFRSESVVRVDYGVLEDEEAEHTATAFAHWRHSVYGDHGHVVVLGPAKTIAKRDW